MEPIAVTGIGITTCLGAGREENWRKLRAGKSGLGPVTRFELGDYPVREGGEAPSLDGPESNQGSSREFCHLVAACVEACEAAGFDGGCLPDPSRSALVVGSSLAGSSTGERFFAEYLAHCAASDFGLLEGYYVELQLEALSSRLNAAGPSVLISNACAAGASSIARGASLLRAGRADIAVCAGYDPLSIFTFAGFGSLLALSRTRVRPFSKNRDGMLLGDGYAALVLELASGAERAGRIPFGYLRGHGESADSHHLTHPHPDGSGAALAMRRALELAGLSPGDIGYINCHGTATRPNDASEARAMRSVFGERLAEIPVSSSKPFFGHTLGGAGTVEAVVTLLALAHQFLPPTLNLDEPDPEVLALDLVPCGREASFRFAMSSSFGFGGSNASLIFERGSRTE